MTFKELREQAGLTQAALAAGAGLDQTAIGKIELGQVRNPRFSTVVAIAAKLGTTPEVVADAIAQTEAVA